jgi:hypothetical protein
MKFDFVSLGKDKLIKEAFNHPRNINFCKPDGGIWACRYTPEETYICDWQCWCIEEKFPGKWDIGVIFNLKPETRICTIDSYNDLERLMKKYRFSNVPFNFLNFLDFEIMSEDYDVIELTSKGQSETRYSFPYNLYGWDVASVLILNFDVIAKQEPIRL